MRATLLILAGIAGAACGAIIAPAAIASAEPANLTIDQLEAQGFDVKINRFGSAPLDQCVVTDLRNAMERTEFVPVLGDDDGVVPVVVDRSITVTVNCWRR